MVKDFSPYLRYTYAGSLASEVELLTTRRAEAGHPWHYRSVNECDNVLGLMKAWDGSRPSLSTSHLPSPLTFSNGCDRLLIGP